MRISVNMSISMSFCHDISMARMTACLAYYLALASSACAANCDMLVRISVLLQTLTTVRCWPVAEGDAC